MVVALLLLGVAGQSADLELLARTRFAKIGAALDLGASELGSPRVTIHKTWVEVSTANWVYSADCSRNESFRPSTVILTSGGGDRQWEPLPRQLWKPPSGVVNHVRDLCGGIREKLGCMGADYPTSVMKEEIIVGGRPGGQLSVTAGRWLVRFSGRDNDYCQVMLSKDGRPTRIDIKTSQPESTKIADLILRQLGKPGLPSQLADGNATFTIGTFFDPSEYRFETGAFAWEGHKFLRLADQDNPYRHNDFSDTSVPLAVNGSFNAQARTDLVDVAAWSRTQDFEFWMFQGWSDYGRMGGLRGNYDEAVSGWDRPKVGVIHQNLKNYRLVGGEPTATKNFTLSDGKSHTFRFATSRELEAAYYGDLEQCTVAAFMTHGGAIENRFQLRRGLDVWFKPFDERHRLGSGNLRHVFFEGCGAMGFENDREHAATYNTLVNEWLSGRFVDGLRTACGGDGVLDTSGSGGMRFSERYNKGDSISDAWLLAMVNESRVTNMPATVAYGGSMDEALETLANGRFSAERSSPAFAAASVWVGR